jgi:hypothetical protein
MVPNIHICYTASHRQKQIGILFGSKWCHIYTFFTQPGACEKNRVKMVPYIILFFFCQNAAIYTYFCGFCGSKYYIYTHFGEFFGSKRCHIYTFLEFNFYPKNEQKKNNMGGRHHFFCDRKFFVRKKIRSKTKQATNVFFVKNDINWPIVRLSKFVKQVSINLLMKCVLEGKTGNIFRQCWRNRTI